MTTKNLLTFASENGTTTANTTQYTQIAGYNITIAATGVWINAETQKQITIRVAGTASNLRFYVSTEDFAADATLRTRKNVGNGGQSVAYQATGAFEDTVGTDTIAAGDEYNIQNVPPASGTATIRYIQVTYEPTSGTGNILGTNHSLSAASTTNFYVINGTGSGDGNSTESQVNTEQRKTGTFSDMLINIQSNFRTTTTTFRTRLNSDNGGQSIAITTETGIVEDTVGSDSVVATNDFNFSFTTGTGNTAIILTTIITFTDASADALSEYVMGRNTPTDIDGNNATIYWYLSGYGATHITTETEHQAQIPTATTFSELTFNVISNEQDVGENNVFTFRNNTASTALTITNTPGQTGILSDSINTASTVTGDDVCIEVNPAGGATDDVRIDTVVVWGSAGAAPPAAPTDEERYMSVNTIPSLSYPPTMNDLLAKIGGSRTNVTTFQLPDGVSRR